MTRTPIDVIVDKQGIYHIEVHEVPTPWSMQDPWLCLAVCISLTGARWVGPGKLEDYELDEVTAWMSSQYIYPRATGRVVQANMSAKYAEILLDTFPAASITLSDISNSQHWGKAVYQIMSPQGLDYPIGIYTIDPQNDSRVSLKF